MAIDLKNIKTASFEESAAPQKQADTESINWWNKDIQLLGSGLSLSLKEAFFTELEILLTAGLDIQSSLQLIADSRKPKNKKIFETIKGYLLEGQSLSQALKQTNKFSDYEVYSIQIGEESGRLNQVLKELAAFYAKSMKYRKQLVGALSYPIFVTGFALMAVFFLLNYLVPLFSSIYSRFEGELPDITQFIINISDAVSKFAFPAFLGFIILLLVLYSIRKKDTVRKIGSSILLRIPILGGLFKKIYLARFCQSMTLLLSSKVPLLKAVELVGKMISFYPLETSLKKTEQDLLQGQFLHHSLAQFPLFPKSMLALVKVGEEAGKLDTMFQKIADQYNEEIDRNTNLIGALLEPILIIFLGILVAVILVAMYLPLFQLSTNFGI